MDDRRPEVVLASTRAAMDADVTGPQLERLRGFADFRFGAFDRPTSWDEPPPPEFQQLLAAVAGNQESMDGFARLNAGVTSPAEFFAQENVARIFAAASR